MFLPFPFNSINMFPHFPSYLQHSCVSYRKHYHLLDSNFLLSYFTSLHQLISHLLSDELPPVHHVHVLVYVVYLHLISPISVLVDLSFQVQSKFNLPFFLKSMPVLYYISVFINVIYNSYVSKSLVLSILFILFKLSYFSEIFFALSFIGD